jgi:hypothetical protein
MGRKLFNNLSKELKDVFKENKFRNESKKFLLEKEFYSIDDCFQGINFF